MTTKITFLFCLLLAVACVPTELTPTPQEALAEITIPAARPTQTATLRPETPTPYPATSTPNSPFFFEEIDPNAPTSTPTLTPTPTPTLISHYDLPTWINDPNTEIIGLIDQKGAPDDNPLKLINIMTNEIFEIATLPHANDFTWGEDATGIYFQYSYYYDRPTSSDTIIISQFERVYIASGEFTRFDSLLSPDMIGHLSPNHQYIAYMNNAKPENLLLKNIATGEIIITAYSFGYSRRVFWSPNSVLVGVSNEYPNSDGFTTSLTIFTLSGEIFRQYYDLGFFMYWSPIDSNQIYVERNDNTPCILNIQTSQLDCLTEIDVWRKQTGVETGFYFLLDDGSQMGFAYGFPYPDGGSGVCIIEIASRDIRCPITHEMTYSEIYHGGYVVAPRVSPNGVYLMFEINDCWGCDDATGTQLATINMDGSDYRLWGIHEWDAGWRPDLNP